MPRLTHMPLKELDLTLVHASSMVDRVGSAVPGLNLSFKTSAAFFTSLRANLVLPATTLDSPYSTPLLDPSSSQTLPLLLPFCLTTMPSPGPPSNSLDEIPPLSTSVLTTSASKIAALKLIADSIAQQRQLASRSIIFHPVVIAGYIALLAITAQLLYKGTKDLGLLVTTFAGLTMILLVLVRTVTSGYLSEAESLTWKFAQSPEGDDDIIIGSQYGEDIIGALVLRLERSSTPSKRKKSGGKGVVRAWTTKMRYRGTGIGTALLEEAVRVTREKMGNSAEIGFAAEHANSKTVLPEMFNGGFRKREAKAAKALEGVIEGAARKR